MRAENSVLNSVALAAAICGLWVVLVVAREWNHEQLDLTALYYASRFYALGQFDLVYDAESKILLWNDAPQEWQAMAESLGQASDRLSAYVYPPLWAWVISFVSTTLSPLAFFNAANALFATVFALGLLAVGRCLAVGTPIVIWVLISLSFMQITMIGQAALQLGQPQTLVAGIMLAAFAAYHRSLPWVAGGLLGLAAALKLSPLIFAVVFLADRNWRALAGFVVVGGGLGLASIAVAGWPMHEVFLDRLSKMDEMIVFSRINLSIQATITYLLEGAVGYEGYIWVELPATVRWVAPALTLLSVGAVYVLRSRGRDVQSLVATLLVLGFAMPLSAPLGWIHYLLFVIGLAPGITAFLSVRQAALVLLAFTAMYSLFVFEWLLERHLAVSMLYSAALTLAFCAASFLFGLKPRSVLNA